MDADVWVMGRERHIKNRRLEQGIQAEVDTHDVTRITAGINPRGFDWKLDAGESFQTPEAVMVYSEKGIGDMSRTFHQLYGRRLVRGIWREQPRPILINNWEANYFDFTEERLKIQYGTSMCYPLSSMGSHVSVAPNHQVFRMTPLHTRANTAYFGTFGYELDLNKLSEEEIQEVKEQIAFMKKYREIIQFGNFYRLKSPFEGNETVWMVVSSDQNTAIVGWYRVLNGVNMPYSRVKLQGLCPDTLYENVQNGTENYGDELMNLGLITSDVTAGQVPDNAEPCTDFESRIYLLRAKESE